jgi:hypothetical protein
MKIRDHARTVTMASMLALTIASLAVAQVSAAPNTTPQGRCESRGYTWDAKKGCADKSCETENGYKHHGDTVTVPGTGTGHIKLRTTYKCNGFTGKWEQVSLTHVPQTGTTALPPTTNQRLP